MTSSQAKLDASQLAIKKGNNVTHLRYVIGPFRVTIFVLVIGRGSGQAPADADQSPNNKSVEDIC